MDTPKILLVVWMLLLFIGAGLVLIAPRYAGIAFWCGIGMVVVGLFGLIWSISRKNFLE